MEGHALISTEVLCRYAADAAEEIDGVRVAGRRGVKLETDDEGTRVELHVAVEWGVSIPETARAVQARVRDYLKRMADVDAAVVDVVVEEVS